MYSIGSTRIFLSFVQLILCIFLIFFLAKCGSSQRTETYPVEVLQAPGFRLLESPQEIVLWDYHYRNRGYSLPFYRTPTGAPSLGWRRIEIPTRRFFTDQSARIYYRPEDLRKSKVFASMRPAGAKKMRIWPPGAILVLETYPGEKAHGLNETPLGVDCIRKFAPHPNRFPENTFFAGEWCYQRFSLEGKTLPLPEGPSACHQCHSTALHLTGDLVFTVFSKEEQDNGSSN